METTNVSIERHGKKIKGTYELLPNRMMKVSSVGLKSCLSARSELKPEASARILLGDMYDDAKAREEWLAKRN